MAEKVHMVPVLESELRRVYQLLSGNYMLVPVDADKRVVRLLKKNRARDRTIRKRISRMWP
jgi:hypothetical protein